MDFHPTFSKENDQNHPYQEPRALNPIAIAYLKTMTSIFWLLMRLSFFYRLAWSEKTEIILPRFYWFLPHFFQRKWPESSRPEARSIERMLIEHLSTLEEIDFSCIQ